MSAPRHFSPTPDHRPRASAAPGAPRNYTVGGLRTGMPAEQMSRLSVRKAFVDTKLVFMQVLAQINRTDAGVEWLRKQVRSAQMPEDLWLLRAAVYDALRSEGAQGAELRELLRRSLDGLLPGTYMPSGFTTL
ncbi:hypothetical protein [uncultured Aquincola sp.]|uniref:hypothetical protein n=1 Tax=uncultured Aquincola sp. TaxID=886556 RepID=UPI0032B29752